MNKEGYLDQPSRQDLLHWAGRAISVLAISASSVFIPHSTQLGGAVENKPVPVNSLNPVDNESPIQYDQFDNNVNPTCAVVADANLIERDLPNTVITDQEIDDVFVASGGTWGSDGGSIPTNTFNTWESSGLAGTKIVGYQALNPENPAAITNAVDGEGAIALMPDTAFGIPNDNLNHVVFIDESSSSGVSVVEWGIPTDQTWSWLENNAIGIWTVSGLSKMYKYPERNN